MDASSPLLPSFTSLPVSPSARPAIFLDRDGTLNVPIVREGRSYPPESVEDFRLFEGVPAACRDLHSGGYVLVVATNQPDVGRGTHSQIAIEAMHVHLRRLVPEISRIETCYSPGREGDPPDPRRKPNPGMLLEAARELHLDLARSWMIGDRWRDIDCGRNAGVHTVFIDFKYAEPLRAAPDFTVGSFAEAARIILAQPESRKLNSPLIP